jgi:hypothetical protein
MPLANDCRVKAGHFPRDHSKETCRAQKIDCSSPPLTQFQVRPNLWATPAIIFDIAISKKHSGVGFGMAIGPRSPGHEIARGKAM